MSTPAPPAPVETVRGEAGADVRVAVSIAAALAVIGVVLGLVWAAWSPDRPPARVTPGGRLQFESETWIAADGRYLVMIVAAGLIAAVLAWTRTSDRGTVMVLGLGAGGLAGAALTWLTGWLVGGGSDDTQAGGYIPVTRLSLHTPGLVFLEAGVAVLVYGLCIAFAARDDLGRPDPVRDRLTAAPAPYAAGPYPPGGAQTYPPPSVGAGGHPQDGGGDGDAAGAAQQRDLPPQ